MTLSIKKISLGFIAISLSFMMLAITALPADAATLREGFEKQQTEFGQASYGEGFSGDALSVRIGGIIGALLATLGIVLVIIILRGGFMYMTAGGNDDQVAKAKKWLINGIIGLVIVLLSYVITQFVVNSLAKPTSLTPTASGTPGSGINSQADNPELPGNK